MINQTLKLKYLPVIAVSVMVAALGYRALHNSRAATNNPDFNSDGIVNIFDLSILAGNWSKTGQSQTQGDANGDGIVNIFDLSILAALWGQAVNSNCADVTTCLATDAGAHLPISYNLSSLTNTIRYVAPGGSDAAGNPGTSVNAPLATLARALTLTTAANSNIVVRGGEYRDQSNIEISGSSKNGLKIIAYPGELPTFNGAQAVSSSSGWTTEGSLKYRTYQPRPVADGGGVAFSNLSNMQNLNGDGVGRYPDQVWIGDNIIRQVINKNQVQDGSFWVDSVNQRLYMTAVDVAKGNIETSQPATGTNVERNRAIRIYGATNVTIEGLRFNRYSPNANDYGVITIDALTNGATLRNIEVLFSPYDGIAFTPIDNPKLEHATVSYTSWQAVTANMTDNFIMDGVKVTNTDPFDEFESFPASGALKTSRTRNTVVKNSQISNNNTHGLWFDQSNIHAIVANSRITDNTGAGVFYEISDDFLLINNYVKTTGSGQPVKLAGSSGLKLVNNTLIGGVDPIGLYTDGRSTPGCAAAAANCLPGATEYSSERQGRFTPPATMDWMPRLDLMINNIVAYPSGGALCAVTALCITTYHNIGATVPLNTIIHQAEPARNIPQTQMNGNVYANGSSPIIRVSVPAANYTTLSSFITAMANSPVSIPGLEANGRYGNSWVNSDGNPTSALSAVHNQAVAIPTDADINQYINPGVLHYGVVGNNQE